MNFEGTFPPQCFWLLQSCIWSQVLKCCVYYEASVYKCNLTVFTLSLLEYKHCPIWLVYIFCINFNKFDLFLSRCCCRPSVIFISMHAPSCRKIYSQNGEMLQSRFRAG